MRFTTIASKLTFLVGGISIFITLIGSYFILQREYQSSRQQFLARYYNVVAETAPQYQPAIFYQDFQSIEKLFDTYFKNIPIKHIAIYDPGGNLLVERKRDSQPEIDFRFQNLIDFGDRLLTYEKELQFSSKEQTVAHLFDTSIPVFSPISPLDTNINKYKFIQLLSAPMDIGNSHFIGYIHVGLDESRRQAEFLIFAGYIATGALIFILIAIFLTLVITRRITAPLAKLAAMADDISLGKLNTISIRGSTEVQMIAIRLNVIIDQLASHKTNIDVDNRLLNLKIDERTGELSARDKELNLAIKVVTETKDRLRRLAYYDTLTTLPNRRSFNEKFQLLLSIARREKLILALLFIDIDNFKRINDSLGHDAGDELLKDVAVRIKNTIRENDLIGIDGDPGTLVSRFGGDEFTVILNRIDKIESAGIVAQRLLSNLTRPITISGHEIVVTPSIGIAIAPRDGEKTADLLKHADTAMYHAKTTGKNGYVYYSNEMDESDIEELELETALRRAIENSEFELHYQPQVNIDTGQIVGAEALLRWEHPTLGSIPPFEFVSIAEQVGLMGELGDWVLVTACKHMKTIRDKGLELPNISINVSSLQFTDSFSARVKEVLEEVDLDPKSIVIELTEGLVMRNAAEAIKRLNELKAVGVGLSVDDFGTGYSSLSYLTRFPLNELKIDRSFITDIDKSSDNAGVVTAIISMGMRLNFNLIAEGVETAGEYAFLQSNGIKVIQGYLFSKPVNIFDFYALLKHHRFGEKIEEISLELTS